MAPLTPEAAVVLPISAGSPLIQIDSTAELISPDKKFSLTVTTRLPNDCLKVSQVPSFANLVYVVVAVSPVGGS